MATYYKNREGSTPATRTEKAGEDLKVEYSIKCDSSQIEIPERYVTAVEKIAILHRLCAREIEEAKANEYTRPTLDVALIMAVIGNE